MCSHWDFVIVLRHHKRNIIYILLHYWRPNATGQRCVAMHTQGPTPGVVFVRVGTGGKRQAWIGHLMDVEAVQARRQAGDLARDKGSAVHRGEGDGATDPDGSDKYTNGRHCVRCVDKGRQYDGIIEDAFDFKTGCC
jgi:hypothetical protein